MPEFRYNAPAFAQQECFINEAIKKAAIKIFCKNKE